MATLFRYSRCRFFCMALATAMTVVIVHFSESQAQFMGPCVNPKSLTCLTCPFVGPGTQCFIGVPKNYLYGTCQGVEANCLQTVLSCGNTTFDCSMPPVVLVPQPTPNPCVNFVAICQ